MLLLWAQAEVATIATDLAEVLGGALALNLLFGLPLLAGGLITSVVAFSLLILSGRGHRPFEVVVAGLLGVILLGFLYSLVIGGIDPYRLVDGAIPRFDDTDSLLLAAGMLGATVMPHVTYLHGAHAGLGDALGPPLLVRRLTRSHRPWWCSGWASNRLGRSCSPRWCCRSGSRSRSYRC